MKLELCSIYLGINEKLIFFIVLTFVSLSGHKFQQCRLILVNYSVYTNMGWILMTLSTPFIYWNKTHMLKKSNRYKYEDNHSKFDQYRYKYKVWFSKINIDADMVSPPHTHHIHRPLLEILLWKLGLMLDSQTINWINWLRKWESLSITRKSYNFIFYGFIVPSFFFNLTSCINN